MLLPSRLAHRLRSLARLRAAGRDLDDEIRFHLDQEAAKNTRSGMSVEDAQRTARRAFGNVAAMKEAHRDGLGVRWLQDLGGDIRYALRALRRSPTLTGAAVITLALGIGANTAIFSAVNAVVLRPLPFAHPERLVMLWESNPEFHWTAEVAAPANVLDWREQVAAFDDIALYGDYDGTTTLTGLGSPRLLHTTSVTGNFFSVLGVEPQVGRTFRDEETWQLLPKLAVISDRLWREQFSADRAIAGRTVKLNGEPVQIIGVAPPSMTFPFADVDVWQPVHWSATDRSTLNFRRAHWARPIGRLKSGVPVAEASAQLQVVVKRLQQQYPLTNRVMGAGLTPLHDFLVRDTRRPLLTLLLGVALLLLIACANVGNLMLVHAASRDRESALRLALGAKRGRLVRQALTESLVLSMLGGVAGLALGWVGTRALEALQPAGLLPVHDVPLAWPVLLYVLLATTASGLFFGIAPASWQSHRAPGDVLKEGGRGGVGPRMRRWGNALVVAEVAIALLLTVGAGLLVRSFQALTRVDAGFDPTGVLAVQLNTAGVRYDSTESIIAFYDEVIRRARALPGVTEAAAVSDVPLTSWGWTSQIAIAGRAEQYSEEVAHRTVTPGYFQTMHVPIVRGRDFTSHDDRNAPHVVLINESLAKRFFAGQDPVGQRVTFDRVPDSTAKWATIVGVVGDEHQTSLGVDTKMQFTAPLAQDADPTMSVVIRSTGDPEALVASVRHIVADVDPELAIPSIRTMSSVRAASLAQQRFLMTMLLVFATVGLVLAVVGVYGVMAQFARARTREMGIRIALGAPLRDVRWLVVRRGLVLVAGGVVIGITGALLTTNAIRSFLFQIAPADPITFLAVSVLLLASATVATWLPAFRASRTAPATTLRDE